MTRVGNLRYLHDQSEVQVIDFVVSWFALLQLHDVLHCVRCDDSQPTDRRTEFHTKAIAVVRKPA